MAKVQFSGEIKRISGRIGDRNTVNTWNGGAAIIREFTQPTNPNSAEQVKARSIFSSLTKNWKSLDEATRQGWEDWATANPVKDRLGNVVKRSGLSAYLQLGSLFYIRTGTIGPPTYPTMSRPAPVNGVGGFGGTQGAFSFQIECGHGNSSITNLYLYAKVTDPLQSPAYTPRPQDYRLIGGVDTDSVLALQATGATYTFNNTRQFYQEDNRYSLELYVVNSQGWASEPFVYTGIGTTLP